MEQDILESDQGSGAVQTEFPEQGLPDGITLEMRTSITRRAQFSECLEASQEK